MPGRNEPCPCGSGQKYKRCCAGKEVAANRPAASPGAHLHELDEQLVRKMVHYATSSFGWNWLPEAAEAFFDDPDFELDGPDMMLFMCWAVHHWELEGRPVREWFLEERGAALPEAERAWLLSQRPVVLTVWEVREVREGVGLRVKDLLGGEERFVHEVLGSRQLRPRDAVLARLVEHEGLAVFGGMYPHPLPPAEADGVVRATHKVLRVPDELPITREKLALQDTSLGLLHDWREALELLDMEAKRVPELRNTDDEPFVLVEEHYALAPENRPRVLEVLAKLEGVEVEEDEEGVHCTFLREGNAMHRDWANTVIGRAHVGAETLRLEANSVKRADALRLRVEAACDGLITHQRREEIEISKLLEEREGQPASPREPPSLEMLEVLRDFKARHYVTWVDTRLPALRGKSPRQAVRTAAGRHEVDVLLKELENAEALLPVEERMDFAGLRRELGLEG
ncbi:SEC-C metal-binding domain-containing protein [Archangium sp.]|uniref:SEC-C metal-binding domain-containing protein n=1 Tax=Archangium sp. TaxID=1872627 RepID=UPI002D6C4BDC|nr:SEC-C metal-binding domain-containing protein [Archangium sp.]HYO55452.1 SEC-C metal-binding domain-containing protein [Archangium sp.]